ncbi:hypothetical protein KY362_03050 [Candidatus Woesearchaeota archaeon]|nr:hypothetical protein [Candidatus Woesearchaeota archaeon]
MEKKITYTDIIVEYYKGLIMFGAVAIAFAVWVYQYHYIPVGDDVLGVLAAGSLFLGTFLIGQGIRGYRDGEELRNRFFKMKPRKSEEEITIRKRLMRKK